MSRQTIDIRRTDIASAVAERLLLALNAEMLERYPEYSTKDYFRLEPSEVVPGRGAFLIVYCDDTPLACGAVRLIDPDTAEIRRMYVEPGARRRGLGRSLLEALEAEARRLGAKALLLATGPRQPDAVAAYASKGFSEIAAFGEYEAEPLSLFMGKQL